MMPPELAELVVTDEGIVVVNRAPPGMKVRLLLLDVPSVFEATNP
jgi:hypothetical protein